MRITTEILNIDKMGKGVATRQNVLYSPRVGTTMNNNKMIRYASFFHFFSY